MEKVFKDPLAKHKQGEGVTIPVAPSRSSKHSSRENEGSRDKPKERERENDRSSRSSQHSATKSKPEVDMPPTVTPGGFAIFSDALAQPEEVKPSRKINTAIEKPKPVSSAAKSKPTPSASFAIFDGENNAAAGSSKKKASCAAPAKSSGMAFSIFDESTKPAEKPVEKMPAAPAPTNRPETKAKQYSLYNDMDDEPATAYDDTTINTKIAKMDIDAMFFDCDDVAPAASKPLDLAASSSVVFPAVSSIAAARHGVKSAPEGGEGGKKDSGFVVFDDFSVIKSV